MYDNVVLPDVLAVVDNMCMMNRTNFSTIYTVRGADQIKEKNMYI